MVIFEFIIFSYVCAHVEGETQHEVRVNVSTILYLNRWNSWLENKTELCWSNTIDQRKKTTRKNLFWDAANCISKLRFFRVENSNNDSENSNNDSGRVDTKLPRTDLQNSGRKNSHFSAHRISLPSQIKVFKVRRNEFHVLRSNTLDYIYKCNIIAAITAENNLKNSSRTICLLGYFYVII